VDPQPPFTYREVGATRSELPAGYSHVDRRDRVGQGRAAYRAGADGLMRWQVQRGAGLRVTASTPVAEVGTVVVSRLGVGPLGLDAPCRVVYVIDEPDRCGYGYGTLPGHPAAGEEAFLLEIGPSGAVDFVIRAFSRPVTLTARLGGPMSRLVQRRVTENYVRAMRRLTTPTA
jgi:uncharacterized protein (UPF0548 family)